MTFLDFLSRLGVRLEGLQAAFWGQVADGVGADPGAAEELFGAAPPATAPRVVVAVKGARIGWSYLGSLRLLHLALTVRLARLADGERAVGIIVAPDLRLARQAMRYVAGAIEHAGLAADAGASGRDTSDRVIVCRADGQDVAIECLPATAGGSAVRGRTVVGAMLDEAAFFRDRDAVVNDEAIYRAILPRIIPGGQMLVGSTPWSHRGLLAELYRDGWGRPNGDIVVARLPTLAMRTAPDILAVVEMERRRDESNWRREYAAEFLAVSAEQMYSVPALTAAVDDSIMHEPGDRCVAGVDLGLVRDHTAVVVVARRGDVYVVLDIMDLAPRDGIPLRPTDAIRECVQIAQRYQCEAMVCDMHYRESVREYIDPIGIRLVASAEGQRGKVDMYLRLRTLLHAGRVVLPRHNEMLRQLGDVRRRATPGGGISVESPRSAGGHGDIVSALVAAVWYQARVDTEGEWSRMCGEMWRGDM